MYPAVQYQTVVDQLQNLRTTSVIADAMDSETLRWLVTEPGTYVLSMRGIKDDVESIRDRIRNTANKNGFSVRTKMIERFGVMVVGIQEK
jgi:hypothetical protein